MERKHQHITESGLSTLHTASVPKKFWDFAFDGAIHIINRLPTSLLKYKSPFELLHGHKPDYSTLKAFVALCYPWLRPYS